MNIFTCTHCLRDWTIAELAENGISFTSFLQRSVCSKALKTRTIKALNVFVCEECTDECEECQPLIPTNDSMENASLVYYAPPSADQRNMGACFDVDVKKVCLWFAIKVFSGKINVLWIKSCDYPSIKRIKLRKHKHVRESRDKGVAVHEILSDEEENADQEHTEMGEAAESTNMESTATGPLEIENENAASNGNKNSKKRKNAEGTTTGQKRTRRKKGPQKPTDTEFEFRMMVEGMG